MTDSKLEIWIGNLLRTGVSLAAIVVAAGGALLLAKHGMEAVNYHVFLPYHVAAFPDPDSVIQFGLLILIATPIFRVLFALIGFWVERDYLYVGVSAIVLTVLGFSIWHAL
jgi:uncharacterized membrane protein